MGFLTSCPICGGGFKDGRLYTGTSGVAFAPPHPLYKYCDAGLHLDCLESWPMRNEFSIGYFELNRSMFLKMRTLLGAGDGWILGCGPAPLGRQPYYAEIDLAEWPCRLKCNWKDWQEFLSGSYRNGLAGQALAAAEAAISQAASLAPDLATLARIRIESLRA